MNCINDLNTGEVRGGSVHLDAQTVMRLKQYRIDHINDYLANHYQVWRRLSDTQLTRGLIMVLHLGVSNESNGHTIKAAGVRGAAEISIYEEVGGFGITAKQFAEDLKALGDVSHIDLRIHSPGGDVFEGIAIYNLLRNHPAEITVHIINPRLQWLRLSQWLAIVFVMPENAMMMIHKPWGISGGNAGDRARHYADLLDKVETVLIPADARKTGKSAAGNYRHAGR